MTMVLTLAEALPSEGALRRMILLRKVGFDHDPFHPRNAAGAMVRIGFPPNRYATFHDPPHLLHNDDQERRKTLRDLREVCRLRFRSLKEWKSCEYSDPSADRILHSPEQNYRAEVCAQIRAFDRSNAGDLADRHVSDILDSVDCPLKFVGVKWKRWNDEASPASLAADIWVANARQAAGFFDRGAA